MQLQHLECTDVCSVILEPLSQVSDGGIVLTKEESISASRFFRAAVVVSAPENYSFPRGEHGKRITTASPVKAGQRILLDRFAGITQVVKSDDGQKIHLVRMHEILGVLNPDTVVETPDGQ